MPDELKQFDSMGLIFSQAPILCYMYMFISLWCETWTCYRRHIKQLEQFHMRHLCAILKIKWQDKISNIEILERSRCSSIEAMIISAQLRWVGHVVRMADDRTPKQLLYGELAQGKRSHGGQKKRFKGTLKL